MEYGDAFFTKESWEKYQYQERLQEFTETWNDLLKKPYTLKSVQVFRDLLEEFYMDVSSVFNFRFQELEYILTNDQVFALYSQQARCFTQEIKYFIEEVEELIEELELLEGLKPT